MVDRQDPPGGTDPSAPVAASDGEPVLEAIRRLRRGLDEPAAPPETEPEPEPESESARSLDDREPEPEPDTGKGGDASGGAGPGTTDDDARRRRDDVVAPLVATTMVQVKRLLQDEQNVLLDTARRLRTRVDATAALPDLGPQADAWATAITPALDDAYAHGRVLVTAGRRPRRAPRRLVAEAVAALVVPLRERLASTIATVVSEGPYETTAELQRALTDAVGARYREFRTHDLEDRLGDAIVVAYARGAYDAAPAESRLRWVPAEPNQCPDADDNALEPTIKGMPFPTGQPCPPAHPGCRCLLLVAEEPLPATGGGGTGR